MILRRFLHSDPVADFPPPPAAAARSRAINAGQGTPSA